MKITTVGIDLAKNVFQVHGIDVHGKVLLKKQLRRDQMATFFVNLPPCLIGIEACGSAHHWARKLQSMGPHRAIDGASIRQTVRQDQQE
jgi:transposase